VTNTESSKEANLHFKLSSVPALPWWLKSLTVIMVSFTCKSYQRGDTPVHAAAQESWLQRRALRLLGAIDFFVTLTQAHQYTFVPSHESYSQSQGVTGPWRWETWRLTLRYSCPKSWKHRLIHCEKSQEGTRAMQLASEGS
jgi:hypothetical protein